jgi:acyl carrier protein
MQNRIAGIWAETLGVEKVSGADDFFSLGGDSIMVTIMVMQVEQAFDIMINPDVVYESPTLEGFAAAIFAEMAA